MKKTTLPLASMAAALVLASMMAFVVPKQHARAAFPGINGKIAFVSGHPQAIYTINSDGSALQQITHYPPIIDYPWSSPAWSPDGTKIAYAGAKPGESGASIYVVSARGGIATKLTSKGLAYDPTWSPDGKKIAYTAAHDLNTQTDILAKSTAGSTPTRVTNTKTIWESEPTWSPSGRRIAYI